MRGLITIGGGVLCSCLWLCMLVATDFNLITISAGLLGMLYLTGSSAGMFGRRKESRLSPAPVARPHPAPAPWKDTP